MITYVCAWCGATIKSSIQVKDREEAISHGMCDNCFIQFIGENVREVDSFLNTLDGPILCISSVGGVVSANSEALQLVDNKHNNIRDQLGGDVFHCKYAALPEGCGNTVHCKNCTIRNTVMDTMSTGKAHYKVPATLNQETPDSTREVKFHISTEKKGDAVLLRVDSVG